MSEAYPTRSEKWAKKLDRFFETIAVLEPDDEMKAQIAIETKRDLGTSRLYWIQLTLSSLIGVLGLIQNSVAVIIGAMLIAPFFGPIQCIAYGIINGENKMTLRAIRALIISMCVTVGIGYLVVELIGFNLETPEIIARTQPTILDLMIALASGVLAFLSLRYDRLSASIAGVAMASAILPPLLVVGIELALGWYIESWKALFLFLTNLVAILSMGMIMFVLFGYSAHVSRQLSTVKNAMIVFCILCIMIAPLASSFMISVTQSKVQHKAKSYLQQILLDEFSSHKIRAFSVRSMGKDHWHIEAEVMLPEGEEIYIENKDAIEIYLRDRLQDSVDLDLIITRSVSLESTNSIDLQSATPNSHEKEELFSVLKNEIIQELRTKPQEMEGSSDIQDNYEYILTQTWKKILTQVWVELEDIRIGFNMSYFGREESFDPKKIQTIDFVIRAKGAFWLDTHQQLQNQIIQLANETFPFSSTIKIELTPVFDQAFTIR